MEREILFRGKTINSGEWIESMTISRGVIHRKINNIFLEIEENRWKGIIPETLGQFTGLYDKNGTKIFEGDIISGGRLCAIKDILLKMIKARFRSLMECSNDVSYRLSRYISKKWSIGVEQHFINTFGVYYDANERPLYNMQQTAVVISYGY